MTAYLKNGRIVMHGSAKDADVVESEEAAFMDEEDVPTIYERLQDCMGMLDGLPSDFSRNHDHYLHGMSKK